MLSKKLWGIIFVGFGIVLGLNVLGITNINIFFDGWWTLFIIVPSLIDLFNEKESKTSNLIGLIVGVILLLSCLDIINFEVVLKLIIPVIFVSMGLSFIFSDNLKKTIKEKFKEFNKNDLENIVSFFSERDIKMDNDNFKGCNLDTVFGSINLDLSDAYMEKETIIRASSIFGSIDIKLADDVNVVLNSIPIFGSITNRLRHNKDNKKTIYIDAFCLFGGINIR